MSFPNIKKTLLLGAGLALLGALLLGLLFSSPADPLREEENFSPVRTVDFKEAPLRVNILVAGRDRASGLFDVLMLLRMDESAGSACVLQIPRDTYAAYTDASYRKLNGAPARLGLDAFCEFLSASLGLPIHHYVALDLDALGDAVDALGGVEITLPRDLDYDDPAQGLSIHLDAGRQILDGRAAEELVRYRSGYLRGDLGRMDAQKLFLAALLARVRTVELSEAITLARVLLPTVNTDLTVSRILRLYRLLPAIADDAVTLLTLPGEDCVGKKSGASYYVVSAPAATEALARYFGAEEAFDGEAVFRHATNRDFAAIYDAYRPYRVYSAAEIGKSGIEIEKTP